MAKKSKPPIRQNPQKSGDTKLLIAEVKKLLKQYAKQEQVGDDDIYSDVWRNSNCLWMVGDGPIAKKLQKHLKLTALMPFWAKYFDVTELRFKQWLKHKPYQCSKVLKSGEKCKGEAKQAYVPKLFVAEFTDRCSKHSVMPDRESKIESAMITHGMSRAEAEAFQDKPREQRMKETIGSLKR